MDSNVVSINREQKVNPSENLSIEKKSVYRYGKMEIICPDSEIAKLATRAMIFRIIERVVWGVIVFVIGYYFGLGEKVLDLAQVLANSN